MPLARRAGEFVTAAALAALALAVSPVGLRLATGRLDLSPRINVLSVTFTLFLVVVAAAIATTGRARRVFFHILVWCLPVALLAALELAALRIHLADRIAPLEDLSIVANRDNWPAQLMSRGRRVDRDGLPLEHPWQGNGVDINALGLRTALPSPKRAGEWRIAVTGGSAAWGWRVRDADTIPAYLQALLRAQGHDVTVYNFAVDGITLADELAILKRFRDVYAIDQVVFYTGGNDATSSYTSRSVPDGAAAELASGANAFELMKVATRLKSLMMETPPSLLARLDNDVLPELARRNSLRDGVLTAGAYCAANQLRCDFILQPMLLTRRNPRGTEIPIVHTLERVYPRYREVIELLYRSVGEAGPSVYDGADMFERSSDPYFFDAVHVNEAGNRFAAERIAAIIAPRLP